MYTIIKTILILTFLQGCFGFSSKFTPMEINNHPCTPENLKVRIVNYTAAMMHKRSYSFLLPIFKLAEI